MYWVTLIVFIIDQFTKWIIRLSIKTGDGITIIPYLFNIIHSRNRGAAFGIFQNYSQYLTVITFVAVFLILYLFITTPKNDKLLRISYGMILGGALGNLYDRIINGYVTDFLDFHIGQYSWPTFNIADSSISIAIVLIIYDAIQKERAHTNLIIKKELQSENLPK
jgi:signal peptidase II